VLRSLGDRGPFEISFYKCQNRTDQALKGFMGLAGRISIAKASEGQREVRLTL
jgi:hypothetical protein